MDLLQRLLGLFYWYFRPVIKWFLRRTTRLCELQRICYGETPGAPRTCAVEMSMESSRNSRVREEYDRLLSLATKKCQSADTGIFITTNDEDQAKKLGQHKKKKDEIDIVVDELIAVVISEKTIKRDLHIQFVHSLDACLRQVFGYKKLCHDVENMRSTPYDSENLEHERGLLQLWSLLQPGIPLATRKTRQWQNIGFQGDDPKTDFRGMGILGLENLLYFAREYNTAAKHILSHSNHPKHGYSFAIVGINLTHMAYRLLSDGSAKSHVYNTCVRANDDRTPSIKHFHHLYCYLFVEFDKFWLAEKPRDVMEFNRIRDLFENNVRTCLADRSTQLKINIVVDNV